MNQVNEGGFSFTKEIILENDRARMTPLSMDHLPDLLPISNQYPNLLQYSPSPFGTESKLKAYIQGAIDLRTVGQRYPFAVYDKKNRRLTGSSSYGNISEKDKRLEIGWTWIAPDQQQTGLNQAMKYLMLSYAFEQLNYQRVEFRVDDRNEQSKMALGKIGAHYEGTLRSHTVLENGTRRATSCFSILCSEWPEIMEKLTAK
ncbi:MAG: RimJ/RimL family protein N-acetyltransferase [Cyclobacteriaceae bacterium]|jgi:RimJ/RimL family protein N-acetyltransferase